MLAAGCTDESDVCGGCDDGILCTIDSCDEASKTCRNEPLDALCCAGEMCDPVRGCIDAPACLTDRDCDDDNPCTDDRCNQQHACTFTNNTGACDDGNPCTDDTCDPATGCAHTATDCDDNDMCTTDTCDPATGCAYSAVDLLPGVPGTSGRLRADFGQSGARKP